MTTSETTTPTPLVVSGFDEDLGAHIQQDAEHAEDMFGDTLRLLARYGSGEPHDVAEARLAAIDPNGVEFATVSSGGDEARVRVEFPQPATSEEDFVQSLMAATAAARGAAPPEEPLTRLEQELAEEAAATTLVTTVARRRELSPNMLELTLAGGLEAYTTRGPGEFVTLFAPRAGHEGRLVPGLAYAHLAEMPEEERPIARAYTIRAWRPESGELDVWFVLHEHRGGMADWARTVEPGAPVGVRGPRLHLTPPEGTDRVVLLGDETFFPATAAALEGLDPAITVEAYLETVDAAHEVALPAREHATVHWLHRGAAPAGSASGLLEAARTLELDEPGVYIAGAGETGQMNEVRRHLRRERGLPGSQVGVIGYWHLEDNR